MDLDQKPQDDQPTVPPTDPGEKIVVNMMPKAPVDAVQSEETALPPKSSTLADEALQEEAVPTQSLLTSDIVQEQPVRKSRRPLLMAIAVVILLLVAGAIWYVLYGMPTKKQAADTTKTTDQSTIVPATSETNGATLDAAADSLEASATDEATAAGTDDTSSATDASTTASKVGDSINENDF